MLFTLQIQIDIMRLFMDGEKNVLNSSSFFSPVYVEMEMKERKYGAIYTNKYAEELVYMTLLMMVTLTTNNNKRIYNHAFMVVT